MIAAVSAAEAGAKKILILEKMKATGGTTIGIGGLFGMRVPCRSASAFTTQRISALSTIWT